jgi:hypothetical protein
MGVTVPILVTLPNALMPVIEDFAVTGLMSATSATAQKTPPISRHRGGFEVSGCMGSSLSDS